MELGSNSLAHARPTEPNTEIEMERLAVSRLPTWLRPHSKPHPPILQIPSRKRSAVLVYTWILGLGIHKKSWVGLARPPVSQGLYPPTLHL